MAQSSNNPFIQVKVTVLPTENTRQGSQRQVHAAHTKEQAITLAGPGLSAVHTVNAQCFYGFDAFHTTKTIEGDDVVQK